MVLVIARWKMKPEFAPEVERALGELQKASRAEEGNLSYDIYRGEETRFDILIYEKYADQAALTAHRESPHFKTIVVGNLLEKLESRNVDVCEMA